MSRSSRSRSRCLANPTAHAALFHTTPFSAFCPRFRFQIADGDNVVLFANHQSEADPQIFSVLLDPKYPGFAEQTIFVAGDRVTTDLLAGPFSMGRNLLCIFSKKHIENPPELKSEKCVRPHHQPLGWHRLERCASDAKASA